jgi:hypothetical protein
VAGNAHCNGVPLIFSGASNRCAGPHGVCSKGNPWSCSSSARNASAIPNPCSINNLAVRANDNRAEPPCPFRNRSVSNLIALAAIKYPVA